jgi:hypothetical protein
MSAVQSPKHALTLHTNCPQSVVVSPGQEPLPWQNASRVATPFSQLGGRHCVLAPGRKQANVCVPLQIPPQAEPSPTQAGRVP